MNDSFIGKGVKILILLYYKRNMSKNIIVPYSSSDFFYVKAQQEGIMPTQEQCDSLDPYNTLWDNSCNYNNFNNNSDLCYRKELCKNKEKVDWITNYTNNGANQNFVDKKTKYNEEILNTINLGIGILIITGLIIKNTYIDI